MKNIAKKLAEIQGELFCPKGKKNEFGGFQYRSCEDILKVLKPLVAKNGCALFIDNEIKSVDGRHYVEATCTLIDVDSGEQVVAKAQAREPQQKKGMDDMQVTGATSSYARKYALAGLFCIDNERDADAEDNRECGKEQPKAKPAVSAKAQPRKAAIVWAEFKALPDNADADADDVKSRFGKLVTEVTGKSRSVDVSDDEWEKVRQAFAAFAA